MIEVECPECGKALQIPEQYAGMTGTCNKCGKRIIVPIAHSSDAPAPEEPKQKAESAGFFHAALDRLKKSLRPKSELEQLLRGHVPIDLVIAGYPAVLDLDEYGQLEVKVETERRPCAEAARFKDYRTLGSDDVVAFLRFYLMKPIGFRFVLERKMPQINLSMAAWQQMYGPKDVEGKLVTSMLCQGFTNEMRGCIKDTKDPSGLCSIHRKEGAFTIWNSEWTTPEQRRQEHLDSVEEDRARREREWKDVAVSISYTATDRQIYLLLDKGVPAKRLKGITKDQASELIEKVLYGD